MKKGIKIFLALYFIALMIMGAGIPGQVLAANPEGTGGPAPEGTGGPSPEGTGGSAQPSQVVQELQLPNPLGADATIEGLLRKIVTWLRDIAAPIAAGMIIYGAYQMLFAAGDPEKFKVGRQTILYTVIGYAIIWIGWGITKIIEEFLSTS